MVNSLLLISPIGMLFVGLFAILWWKIKKKVKWKYFAFGALLWFIAIIPKFLMDYTITISILQWLNVYGIVASLVIMGLYYGLRTGFFESGFSYMAIIKTRFRKMKLNDALAFGIGFGSIEAIALGCIGLINILVFILNPSLVNLLTPEQQTALNLPTIIVAAPVLERLFTLAVHIFSSLLVVYAVIKRKINYLFVSILLKTLLDGMVPTLSYYFNLTTVYGIYLAEIPVLIIGVISFYGIRWITKKF